VAHRSQHFPKPSGVLHLRRWKRWYKGEKKREKREGHGRGKRGRKGEDGGREASHPPIHISGYATGQYVCLCELNCSL